MFFFFFQAEDGIRDVAVTGVQTCALPIFEMQLDREKPAIWLGDLNVAPEPIDVYHPEKRVNDVDFHIDARNAYKEAARSEERRVGKERRARWSQDRIEEKLERLKVWR